MVARVTLEIALRREFDYAIPRELEGRIEVGSRVRIPFGNREVFGVVTGLLQESTQTNLRYIVRVVGVKSLITPRVLELAKWIGDYYCCAPETALKSVLPTAVRQKEKGFKEQLYARIIPIAGEAPKLTKRQQEIFNILEEHRELPLAGLCKLAECTAETVRRLEDKGLIVITTEVAERDPYANEVIGQTKPLPLNAEQETALKRVVEAMDLPVGTPKPRTFMLHGVTGSGKTEVYLQAIAHTLAQGKGAIVLVPEISLTPQTVERFKARFSHGPLKTLVAVLHSHLSSGERHDEWHKIRQGRARIVIGARSAVFAPIDPLGLIIVDEEHEHSYKQEEAPRYHARDVAVVRGKMDDATVVLGSATPSMESYYNVTKGKYELLELPSRADDKQMPVVRVMDMRYEARKEKGPPMFSPQLKEAMTQRLERNEQTILFLNRRGYSTSLQCPDCGFVAECPNCSVSLTFHRREAKLACHICGFEDRAPTHCPEEKCGSSAIRYSGVGTERVEETLGRMLPHARVQRMDSDLMKRKDDYRQALNDFKAGKTDILIGTQMIAKGLHFENVTLVGVIYADLALHIPDFRAGERTFQLLTQVAGRAGRGDIEGEVYVQSFTPFHPAIQYSRRHDFEGFYEQEIEFREQLKYPPALRVALLTLRGRNEEKVAFTAEHLKREIENLTAEFPEMILAGPAPAPLMRAETFYRYQIMIRVGPMSRFSRALATINEKFGLPEDVRLTIDIDPVNLS